MRAAPEFWGRKPALAADLLLPLGAAFDTAGRVRRALARPTRAPVPVICVGNLVAGGAGKTPIVIALAAWLASRTAAARTGTVHIVTRGYGGRLAGPVRVEPQHHDFVAVGDEALLLAAHAPSWVARDRSAGIAAAVAAGAEAILLDDGFQNPSIEKTLALIVIDSAYGFGNGRVMPAGPLRENLRRGLARADGVVLLAAQGEIHRIPPVVEANAGPVVPAVLAPIAGARVAGARVVAFAGIGRPEKFFASLRALGARVIAERKFPDHHPFSAGEIAELRRVAGREGAQLVTTAKDFVRLPVAARRNIEVLEIGIDWSDPAALDRLLVPATASLHGNGRGASG